MIHNCIHDKDLRRIYHADDR